MKNAEKFLSVILAGMLTINSLPVFAEVSEPNQTLLNGSSELTQDASLPMAKSVDASALLTAYHGRFQTESCM